MPHYKYLMIGAGMTADAAVHGIREVDSQGSIGLIGTDPHPPYTRPYLSKGLWKDKPLESVWRGTESQGVQLHLGRTVQTLDLRNKSVADDQGTVYTYDKLLLATGGVPRRLPFGEEQIIYFRTLDDYQRLRALTQHVPARRFAVIGGGFIGSEIAAALKMNGQDVVMIFPAETIGEHQFPQDLGQFLNHYYQEKGVEILAGEEVTGLETRGERYALQTHNGQEILVDGVVAGIGILPNVALANAAGLKAENGIMVDEFARTSDPDVYAAGDVATFYNPALGVRIRVEHEDNANTMGRLAGRNMAGQTEPYHHLPFFYSDLFELGYEAVGELDSRLQTVADWKDQYHEGIIYYLRDDRVRGVLLWNVWEKVNAARELIEAPGPFRPEELRHYLPN
jgi:3-phenylpropionate/trans-cinnamate dioxygenase ferredoxin reductase component